MGPGPTTQYFSRGLVSNKQYHPFRGETGLLLMIMMDVERRYLDLPQKLRRLALPGMTCTSYSSPTVTANQGDFSTSPATHVCHRHFS